MKRAMALHAAVPTIVKFAEGFLTAVEQVPGARSRSFALF